MQDIVPLLRQCRRAHPQHPILLKLLTALSLQQLDMDLSLLRNSSLHLRDRDYDLGLLKVQLLRRVVHLDLAEIPDVPVRQEEEDAIVEHEATIVLLLDDTHQIALAFEGDPDDLLLRRFHYR